ncbi:MAG: DUF3316 domain-containing protein [Prevotella sp.]|nr:DUF3316 domain-containing protein [Prevotella sp.]
MARLACLLAFLFMSSFLNAQKSEGEYVATGGHNTHPYHLEEDNASAPKKEKVVTNTQLFGIGGTNILDTYLSPEKYKGAELRFISHTVRDIPGKRWQQQMMHQGYASFADDRSGDGSMMGALYTLSYGLQRPIDLRGGKWQFCVGGMADFNIGVLDNPRNQNNPAQLRLSAQVGPAASATYKFHLFGKACSTRYEFFIPVLGVMFSPNYGQSYYEIFSRGDYDHNAVVTTPFNSPSMRHAFTLDFPLWGVTWRVGYLGDYQQAEVNHLKQHNYTHALLLGWVKKIKIINN